MDRKQLQITGRYDAAGVEAALAKLRPQAVQPVEPEPVLPELPDLPEADEDVVAELRGPKP